MKRRTFLKGSLASSALVVAAGAGILKPSAVLAGDWPKAAFSTKDKDSAIKALFGDGAAKHSDGIKIKAPIQAENGAVVPFKVETSLPAEWIAVIVEKNPTPLAAALHLTDQAAGFFSARIKMAGTSDVYAVIKSGDQILSNKANIKVTVGGCGG